MIAIALVRHWMLRYASIRNRLQYDSVLTLTRASTLFSRWQAYLDSNINGNRRSDHSRQYRVSPLKSNPFDVNTRLSPRRPIIQSGFRSSSPAYPLLHIDALNNALAKSPRPNDVDPVIYVPTYDGRDSLLPSACCHIVCGDIRIVCPVSGDREYSLHPVQFKLTHIYVVSGSFVCVFIPAMFC